MAQRSPRVRPKKNCTVCNLDHDEKEKIEEVKKVETEKSVDKAEEITKNEIPELPEINPPQAANEENVKNDEILQLFDIGNNELNPEEFSEAKLMAAIREELGLSIVCIGDEDESVPETSGPSDDM